jgi:hypothetical protein
VERLEISSCGCLVTPWLFVIRISSLNDVCVLRALTGQRTDF